MRLCQRMKKLRKTGQEEHRLKISKNSLLKSKIADKKNKKKMRIKGMKGYSQVS